MNELVSRSLERLKYFATIEMGQSPPSSEYSFSPNVGLPFLQGTADFGEEIPTPRVYCETSTKIALTNDILFSVRAPVGELNIADQPYGIGRGLCAIRCGEYLDKRFAWWVFHWSKHQLAYEATGSTYEAVALEDVANMAIPILSLSQQRAIANYLDRETSKLDALISAKQRLLEVLTEKRRALITHAVTRGLNPDVPMKDSGMEWIGQIPAGWEVVPLKQVAQVRTGVTKGRDLTNRVTIRVPYLRVANVQDGYLNLSNVTDIEIMPSELNSYRLEKWDVLMNEGGDADKLGRGAVWLGSIDPCIHQNHVFAVRCFGIDPFWLNMVTGSDYAKAYFESRAKQTTNLASISATNLQELPVVMPPRKEQLAILFDLNRELETIETLQNTSQQTISLLQERRVALITSAVTGQVDIILYAN